MKEVYIFDYKDAWMILLYKDGKENKYWNSNEDMWDDVLNMIDMLELPKENIFRYKMDSYDQVNEYVNDVFDITEEEILALEKFRIK